MTHDTWAYHDFCLFLLTLLSYHFFPCVKLILIIQKKSGLTSLQFGKTTEKPPSRIKFKIKIWSSKSIYTGWPRSRAFFTFTHFFFQNRSFLVLYTHNVEIPLHMCACVDKTVLWTRIKCSILRVLIIFDFIIRRYLNKCFFLFLPDGLTFWKHDWDLVSRFAARKSRTLAIFVGRIYFVSLSNSWLFRLWLNIYWERKKNNDNFMPIWNFLFSPWNPNNLQKFDRIWIKWINKKRTQSAAAKWKWRCLTL